ncbi:MAG: hypothetical protein VX975_05680 [Acidobacteriota bacterium]|nr:hypothetical protein [Acidobacteriota bacterium]
MVALVGDEIKLTRCTTCDTEHPYKAARVPPRRQTRLVAALSSASAASAPALQEPADAEAAVPEASPDPPPAGTSVELSPVDSVRRPLIRATLERPEGMPPPVRQAPVFTVREAANREGGSRRARRPGGKPQGQPNGNRADGNDAQFGWVGQGKNGSRPPRQRSANRSSNPGRSDRSGKGQPRNRGKGRAR